MKGAMSSVFFQQGFCTAARGYHKRRSPKLYRRCSICSAVPRLTDCPLPMVGTLLRPLPWTAIGIQCWYPSSTPWYSASRCVFDQDSTLAHLPGLYTGSFRYLTGRRRAQVVDAKDWGFPPVMPLGDCMQRSSLRQIAFRICRNQRPRSPGQHLTCIARRSRAPSVSGG